MSKHAVLRRAECGVRARVADLARAASAAGRSLRWLAGRLGMGVSTLAGWVWSRVEERLTPVRRGRPIEAPERIVRRLVLELMWALPSLGARRIAKLVPGLSRRTAADWKERVTSRQERTKRQAQSVCVWSRAGAVWAMDHTKPKVHFAGGEVEMLVVRDLASGEMLSMKPASERTGEEVAAELERLFAEHGAPLVVKCDNGSMLVADPVRELCRRHGVVLLRSPVGVPAFNGACERGLGWGKRMMGAGDRQTRVDTADVEAARRLVNELPRERGPSAEELWTRRHRLSAEERGRYLEVYRAELVRRAEPVELPENLLAPSERIGAILARGAAVAALRELGHVQTRQRPEAAED